MVRALRVHPTLAERRFDGTNLYRFRHTRWSAYCVHTIMKSVDQVGVSTSRFALHNLIARCWLRCGMGRGVVLQIKICLHNEPAVKSFWSSAEQPMAGEAARDDFCGGFEESPGQR